MSTIQAMITQLNIDDTFFIMLALFVITYGLIYQIALKRLGRFLVERDERVSGREEEIVQLKAELLALASRVAEGRRSANAAANAAFNEVKAKAAEEQRKIVSAARVSALTELKAVRAKVADQLAEEIKKVEAEIPRLARQILDQILGKNSGNATVSNSAETEI